jgi:hypothetical protein
VPAPAAGVRLISLACSDNVDLEYKYLVREKDGHVTSWAPGGNFSVQVPVVHDEGKPAGRIDVKDVWDQAWRDIQVVFNEAMAAGKDTCARSSETATAAHESASTSANAASPAAAAMAKYAAMLSAGTADELALLQASVRAATPEPSVSVSIDLEKRCRWTELWATCQAPWMSLKASWSSSTVSAAALLAGPACKPLTDGSPLQTPQIRLFWKWTNAWQRRSTGW